MFYLKKKDVKNRIFFRKKEKLSVIYKYIFLAGNASTKMIDTLRKKGLLPYLKTYLINEVGNEGTHFLDRRVVYGFLGEVVSNEAHRHMVNEFIMPDMWVSSPLNSDDKEGIAGFYKVTIE